MLGVPCRIHDMSGDDLGVAHLPPPVQIGDLIALQHKELRVYDVVLSLGPSGQLLLTSGSQKDCPGGRPSIGRVCGNVP